MPAAACPATAPSTAPPAVVAASNPAPIQAKGNRAMTRPVASPTPAEHAADPRRGLVLAGDLHLPVGLALDHRCVVGVDQAG